MLQDILKRQRAGVGADPLNTTLETTGAFAHDHYPQKRESRHQHYSNRECCIIGNRYRSRVLRGLGYVATG